MSAARLTRWMAVCAIMAAATAMAAGGGGPGEDASTVSADELVRRSIAYHDPSGVWESGKIRVRIRTTYSDELAKTRGKTSEFDLVLAPGRQQFGYTKASGDDLLKVRINQDVWALTLNGGAEISDADRERLRIRPIEFYRDYYEYLYGMPMKLRDPGVSPDPTVERTTFEGRPALAVRVPYEPPVGDHTWYFYFDPTTYGIIGYRFFKDEAKNDGEYIVLEGEVSDPASGFRIPKSQSWYMNADDVFLATDDIVEMTIER